MPSPTTSPQGSPGNDRLRVGRPPSSATKDRPTSQAAQDAANKLKSRVREPENPKLRRALGNGTFGSVYEALDIETGSLIAIKKMQLDPKSVKKEQIERIVHEIQILKTMKHKNIIEYIGAGRMDEGTSLWIAMECAVGGSLANVITRYGNLPESLTKKYVRDCVEGLAYLHSMKVAHRDLKCENLLLCDGGAVKLADFGSAKQFSEEEGLTSTLIGTPLFMAPEVAAIHLNNDGSGNNNHNNNNNTGATTTTNNNNVTAASMANTNNRVSNATTTCADPSKRYDVYRADIYTLGITVIQMLTGRPPFPKQIHWMMHVQNPDSKIELPKNISAECSDFILCCLKRNPKDRLTASELLAHPFIAGVVRSNSQGALSPTMNGNSQTFNNSVSSAGAMLAQQQQAAALEKSGGSVVLNNSAIQLALNNPSMNPKSTMTPTQHQESQQQQRKDSSGGSSLSSLTPDALKHHEQLLKQNNNRVGSASQSRSGMMAGGSSVVAAALNDLNKRTK